MAVEKIEGENYMSDTARVLSPKVTFDVEGGMSYLYDLNGDGTIDENDALVLLQVANGTHDALSEADTARYDFDGDGALTTRMPNSIWPVCTMSRRVRTSTRLP